jgi:hypothetical protein
VATLFEGAEDRHQDGWAIRSTLAAIARAVLADDQGRADCPLGGVVVERNVGLVQKGEQVVLVATQPLAQPLGVAVLPGGVAQLLQTRGASLALRDVGGFGRLVAPAPQSGQRSARCSACQSIRSGTGRREPGCPGLPPGRFLRDFPGGFR